MAKKQTGQTEDTLRQFKQDLKNNTPGNFYIFCGEEAFLRDYYLAGLTKKLACGPFLRRRFWTRWRQCP